MSSATHKQEFAAPRDDLGSEYNANGDDDIDERLKRTILESAREAGSLLDGRGARHCGGVRSNPRTHYEFTWMVRNRHHQSSFLDENRGNTVAESAQRRSDEDSFREACHLQLPG